MRRIFRLPTTASRARAELEEELRFHLEGRVDDLIEREGLSRDEAEREAKRRFGDINDYRSQTRSIDASMLQRRRKMDIMETIRRESRHAFRSLLRAPSFSIIAIVTLALGLGATTTIFTLLDRVVLRPLPYPNADRLIRVVTRWPLLKAFNETGTSSYMYFRFKKSAQSLDAIGIYRHEAYPLPAAEGVSAERVNATIASASTLTVLGAHPELGRLLSQDDEIPTDAGVILISHDLWARRFNADRSIIGKAVDIGSGTRTVVGVLQPNVTLPDDSPDIWTPMHLSEADPPRNAHSLKTIALLKPGVTVDRADKELSDITRQITVEFPQTYGERFMTNTGFGLGVRSLRDDVVGPRVARTLWITFASAALVLLIAAANVANLFLVRIEARRREVAVRAALGADRSHLTVHFLTESALLTLAAGLAAVAIAWILLHIALGLAPSTLPRMKEVALDVRSVVFCVGVSLATGLVFGLLPFARSVLDLQVLRDGGRGLAGSRGRNAARRALVVSQVTLAVVLLASAGLMLRSFERLRAVKPGFEPNGVLTMSILLTSDRYRSEPELVAYWHRLSAAIGALPGVTGVGGSDALPIKDGHGCTALQVMETTLEESQRTPCLPTATVMPGYFRAMGIPLKGHEPDWSDDDRGAGSMVVSRALAERLWPGESAIGKTLVISVRRSLPFVITGIAEDVRANGLTKPVAELAYFPLAAPVSAGPTNRPDMDVYYQQVVVRSTAKDPAELSAAIRRIVAEIDPRVPVADITPMNAIVAKSIAMTSFTMALMLLSAVIALTLSAAGIYGVVSYIVGQRRAEIGIRMALGAESSDVARMVMTQSVALTGAGLIAGVALSLLTARVLRAMLFEVSPSDPVVLVVSCVVLAAVTAAASFGPARRAANIDPVEAMRA